MNKSYFAVLLVFFLAPISLFAQETSDEWFFNLGIGTSALIGTSSKGSEGIEDFTASLPAGGEYSEDSNKRNTSGLGVGFTVDLTSAYGISLTPTYYHGFELQTALMMSLVAREFALVNPSPSDPALSKFDISHSEYAVYLRFSPRYFQKVYLIPEGFPLALSWFVGPVLSMGALEHTYGTLEDLGIGETKTRGKFLNYGLDLGLRVHLAMFYLGAAMSVDTYMPVAFTASIGLSF